ncbi:hypothetical protein PIB30_099536, partial [Stylosanthes scabra]|nr:hypothetical protein [Stylosanthes scabra]
LLDHLKTLLGFEQVLASLNSAKKNRLVGSDGRKTVTAPQGTQSPTAFEPD